MTALYIRNMPDGAADRARRAAGARGLTLAEYVTRLVDLHDATRARADAGDDALQAELTALGLETRRS